MKIVILAGGWGARLGHFSEILPKPMVAIGNKPIIWHIMKRFSQYGFNEFVICLGVKGDVIKNYFSHYREYNNDFTIHLNSQKVEWHTDHEELDWKVSLINTGLNSLKGSRIKQIEPYLDPGFNMLTYGDGVADIDIPKLIEFHKSHKKIITISAVHPSPRFGIVKENKGKVISFQEKERDSQSYINGGFMIFNPQLLDYLSTDENCDFEYGPLDELVKDGQVMAYKHSGSWEGMDNERDVHYLNNLWKNKKAFWKNW